jgi:hypothetical protein
VLTLQLSPLISAPNIDAPVTMDPAQPGITAIAVGEDMRFLPPSMLLERIAADETPVELDDVELYLLDEPLDQLLQPAPQGAP